MSKKGRVGKLRLEHYQQLGQITNFDLVDNIPQTGTKPVRWKCRGCSNIDTASYDRLSRRQTPCRICKRMQELREWGFECSMNTLPVNSRTKVTITGMSCSHIFKMSFDQLAKTKSCPKCKPLYPKDVDDYRQLALSIGYEWVSNEVPENTLYNTLWVCNNGHEWKARYNQIIRGMRCPKCRN